MQHAHVSILLFDRPLKLKVEEAVKKKDGSMHVRTQHVEQKYIKRSKEKKIKAECVCVSISFLTHPAQQPC